MIRFKKKAVLLMGCLFAISFSQGCTSFGSSSQSSVGGVILGNYDVKEKESIPTVNYINYNTTGVIGVNAQIASGSSSSTLAKQNTVEGVTSGIDKNNGTGEETEVITKNKNGQAAVRKAIKGNKELANTTAKRKAIVSYALQWVGNKYHYGGTSLTKGIDCSGFTMRVMEHFGIKLDRESITFSTSFVTLFSSTKIAPFLLSAYTAFRFRTKKLRHDLFCFSDRFDLSV